MNGLSPESLGSFHTDLHSDPLSSVRWMGNVPQLAADAYSQGSVNYGG